MTHIPMKTKLSQDQIQKYRNDGFLYVPGLLDGGEVVKLKNAILEAISTMGRRRVAGEGADLIDKDTSGSKIFTQRLNLWKINETVKSFMLNPELGRLMCEMEGVEGLRVFHDQALIKEPYGLPTAWHLDDPLFSFHSRHAISVWIALEDATPYNGCMCFVPGSHKLARFETTGFGTNLGELFQMYPKMGEIDTVPVPMKAGDCSFHNGLTAHGAGANMTRGRRIAMTCAYMPEGSTYNGIQNIFSDDYAKSLTVGQVLDSEAQNPLVYSSRKPVVA
jgi:phytanoyl-CoA hydroxylase